MKEIKLTQGRIALVDDEDYSKVILYKWCVSISKGGKRCYAISGSGKTRVYMHRVIMNTCDTQVVDHYDGNGLNNQKSNLTNCTQAENVHKGTIIGKYKGTYWDNKYQAYCAQIRYRDKRKFLGYFQDEKDAAVAYNKAAITMYGKLAYQNNID